MIQLIALAESESKRAENSMGRGEWCSAETPRRGGCHALWQSGLMAAFVSMGFALIGHHSKQALAPTAPFAFHVGVV